MICSHMGFFVSIIIDMVDVLKRKQQIYNEERLYSQGFFYMYITT